MLHKCLDFMKDQTDFVSGFISEPEISKTTQPIIGRFKMNIQVYKIYKINR